MNADPGTPSPWLLPLILGAWLVVFPLLWMAICGLLSIVGGWHELAARYAVDSAVLKGVRVQTTTGAMQRWFLPANYSNTLLVHVRDDAFVLGVWRIFRFMHPALLIPFADVVSCEKHMFLFWRYAQIRLSTSPVTILVGGWPGHTIHERWTSLRTAAPAPAMAR